MALTTETELKEVRDLVIGLREEIRVGFANNDTKFAEFKAEIKGEIQRVEAKTDIKFAEIKAEITRVEAKTDIKFAELTGKVDVIDERTKLGFWGFVGRALITSVFILVAGFAIKYFFFGTVKL